MLVGVVVIGCVAWLYLYVESVHQRRKAQRLLSELTSLPIAADFPQVRDLAIRYGGRPLEVQLESPQSICTSQECNFEVKLQPVAGKLVEKNWRMLHELGESGIYLGLRPWLVTAALKIKDGKLQHIRTNITQDRVSASRGYTGPILIWYTADIDRTSTNYSDGSVRRQ
jgi:hypothetical protein